MMDPAMRDVVAEIIVPMFGLVAAVLLMLGGFVGLTRISDRPHKIKKATQRELDALSARIADLENTSNDVRTLQDRVDFLERLLAGPTESGALSRSGQDPPGP